MSTVTTKTYEVRFALSLLKNLGASVNNVYLLLAIVAWTRDASGTAWSGNNPLNINSGTRYASLEAAAYATARKLIAGTGWYDTLLAAARRTANTEQQRQTQAQDFLTALAFSGWDARFYGASTLVYQGGRWLPDPSGGSGRVWVPLTTYSILDMTKADQNRLLPIWEGLLGHPVTIPGTPSKPAPPPPKPAPPKAPPKPRKVHELPTTLRPNYIEPYAARGFYEARKQTAPTVPGPPVTVG